MVDRPFSPYISSDQKIHAKYDGRLDHPGRSNLGWTFVNDEVSASSLLHHTVPNHSLEYAKGWASQDSERITTIDGNKSPNSTSSNRRKTRKQQLSGWYAGALASCFTALIVLAINSSVTIYAAASHPVDNGIGTIFHGDCARAKTINTWLQLAVNVLSTILLGASNYCMQCLGSPTREEVDKGHSRGRFLHLGVPSMHNIMGIGLSRKLLWLSLGLSAFPLHLVCVTIFASALFTKF